MKSIQISLNFFPRKQTQNSEREREREREEVNLSIEPHAVLIKGRADGDGGGGAEVGGIKSNTDAIIDRKDEGFVPLAPVLDHRYVRRSLRRHHPHPFPCHHYSDSKDLGFFFFFLI